MSQSEHTPTPWAVERGWIGGELCDFVTAPGRDGFRAFTDADAHLIVRAVNAHADLMGVLEEVLAEIHRYDPDLGHIDAIVSRALAKARGEDVK